MTEISIDDMSDTEEVSTRLYREQLREWLAANVPPNWRDECARMSPTEWLQWQRSWLRTLRSGGYAAPHWPKEVGGGGATLKEQIAFYEEMDRADAPSPTIFMIALGHAGATLLAHGTEEQRKHLSRILDGEEIWCQGFSEPDAGSDLASLRTRAERVDDRYIVNGQKIWSSLAHYADWCILLVRTDPDAPKGHGITYLLMDMKTPGIDIRPIKQMTGQEEFCELFLTDVEIPVENRIGEENEGWRIAQTTLLAERGPLAFTQVQRLRDRFFDLVDLAKQRPWGGNMVSLDNDEVRQTLATYFTEIEVLRSICERVLHGLVSGTGVGPEGSVIKLFYSEVLQSMTGFGTRLEGLEGQLSRERVGHFDGSSRQWLLEHLGSWAWTIAGGTSEIQRNLVAERVLQLPRDPNTVRARTS